MIISNKSSLIISPQIIKLVKSYHWPFLLVGGVIFATLPFSWDQEHLRFLSISLEAYQGAKETAFIAFLHELFSWAWLYIAFDVLRRLLLPLGDSFSVSQLLWLRLTPCSPWEIAAARAIWVMAYGVWVGVLGLIWVLATSLYHHISPGNLLLDVLGLVSHIIFAGGMVVVLDFGLEADYITKRVIAVIALFVPCFLDLVRLALGNLVDTQYVRFFPYTHPFAGLTLDNLFHFGILGIVGLFFLGLHIVIKLQYSSVKID